MFRTLLLFVLAACVFADSLEDHALGISRRIQERHIPFGTIINPMYASAESDIVQTYTRCGDSAIWTGHWLAAESFRYAVTRSPDALAAMRLALKGIGTLVDAAGSANVLARCVLPVDSPLSAGPRNEERHHREYEAPNGSVWIGNTSRDQYMGVFFGLSVAYEHVADEAIRAQISRLVTRLTAGLLDRNWAVVMPGGDISTVFWLRPDQQLATLQVARQVNPEQFDDRYHEERRRAFGLSLVMRLETMDTHGSYFKFNLDAITFFNLIRLEEPKSSKLSSYRSAYGVLRRAVEGHGNAFFNTIDLVLDGADATRDRETRELLTALLARPGRDPWVDVRGKYRACGSDRACDPIPVADRVTTDFLWQRSPFLLYGGGEGRIEPAGIDFILPYWMARRYGVEFR